MNTTAFAALVVTLGRGRDGIEAKTDVPLDFMPWRVLEIYTSKSSRGGVSAYGSVMTIEKDTGTGYSGRSCILFQDFSKTLAFDKTVRTNEKTVRAIHAQALAALPDTLQAIRVHYAKEIAEAARIAAAIDSGQASATAELETMLA